MAENKKLTGAQKSSMVLRITPTQKMRLKNAYSEYRTWCAENWTPAVTFTQWVPEFCILGWQATLENHKAKKRLEKHE
ncbi:hypothetical protein [Serratia sp. (in: enterobacteria)]|uniref:hypothetical protein n=1 Tax=Serratia sp. (in: enterobacteria) TaxID=616 RepID=UPI0039895E5D